MVFVIEIKEPIDYKTKVDEFFDLSELKELTKNGNADAILKLAKMWRFGQFEKVGKITRTIKIQLLTAEYLLMHIPENGEANFLLGGIYVNKDKVKALEFFMKAIEQENIQATFYMACQYCPNDGGNKLVEPDSKKSIYYYKRVLEIDSDRLSLKSLAAEKVSKMLYGEEKIKYIKLSLQLQPDLGIKEHNRKVWSKKLGIELFFH